MRYQRATRLLKLDGLEGARAYFAGCLAESDPARESLWVAHVDAEANCRHLSRYEGNACRVGLPVRAIIADVVAHSSAGLILAHNHPSGDASPSKADCFATRRLACAAEALDCRIVDHLVFGEEDCSSFRELGLL